METQTPPPPPAAPDEKKPQKVFMVVPMVIAGAFFIEGLDSSIITTSLPQMAKSFSVSPAQMSAAITAYLLSLAIFIPVSGWVADRFGARLVFCSAIALFTFGSVLCGLSNTLMELVCSRVIQGFGGAMMAPVGRLILTRSFPKDQLMRAMTWNMLPGMAGPTLGPLVGGFITTNFSWHWNFFINVPLAVIAIALALRYIPNVQMPKVARFDWIGFFIIAVGLGTAQLALENLGRNTLPLVWEAILGGVAVTTLTLYWLYARRAENPVMDLRMFKIRPFAIAVLAGGVARVGFFSINFLMPLLVQIGFGLTPFEAGKITVFLTIGGLVSRANVSKIARRLGFRNLLTFYAVTASIMMAGFSLMTPETPHIVMMVYLFFFGILRTGQMISQSVLSYADVPNEKMARATSIASLGQRFTQSIGIAVAASLLGGFAGAEPIAAEHFAPVFLIMAVILALPIIAYRYLKPDDGAVVSGHRQD